MKTKQVVFCVLLFAAGTSLLASGFALFEHSARGLARGGAMVAQCPDASSVYYNPAGITQLEGLHFDIGASPIQPVVNVSDTYGNTYDVDDSLNVVPHVFVTYQFSDKLFMGAGVFAPFGLATKFDENWAGRYNNTNADVMGLEFNFNLAYKVTDKFSIAGGISGRYFDVTLEQKILPSAVVLGNKDAIVAGLQQSMGLDPYTAELIYNTQILGPSTELSDIGQSISGDKTEFNYNIALHYKPTDKVSLGFSYRSSTAYEISGQATYKDVTQGFIFPFETIFFDTDGTARLELPAFMYFGVSYQANDRLVLEADLWQTAWSSYDTLDLTLNNGVGHAEKIEGWDDVWAVRLGGEYQINDTMNLQFGYVYDESPIPDAHVDYLLPSNDRNVYSLGYGIEFGNWRFDASYAYLTIDDRQIAARPQDFVFDSVASGEAHLYGIGLTYRK